MPPALAAEPARPFDKPLPRSARITLIASATLVIALFYVFAAISMLGLLLCLAVELAALLAAARFGCAGFVTPIIRRHAELLMVFVRGFWISREAGFRVTISEADAPALFAMVRRLSSRLSVPPPREVLVEMNAGAWVQLRGLRSKSATTLGLGYDLIAGLTESELEAVLAHEMAHAKLVRRGLKWWLNGGLSRAGRITSHFSDIAENHRRVGKRFELAEALLLPAHRITRLTARLVSAYSRQDEFDADAGAAALCGAAPLCAALVKLDAIAAKTCRIGWSERVARLQSRDFSKWLAHELTTAEISGKTPDELFDPYSTHPPVADRLRALGVTDVVPLPGNPAIALLANPDAVGARIVAEIQRVMIVAERKDTKHQARWRRQIQRQRAIRPLQWLALLVFSIGVIVGGFAWVDGFSVTTLLVGGAIIVAGAVLFRTFRYSDRVPLPIPNYEAFKAAWENRDNPTNREAELEAEVEAALAGQSRKAQKQHLIKEGYLALSQCDYLRAHVTSRAGLKVDGKSVELLLTLAIASAAFHQGAQAWSMLQTVIKKTGLGTPSTQWGAGWVLLLLHEWAGASAFLEVARDAAPEEWTLAALLATCDGHRNKLLSATQNARLALAAAPSSRERLKLLVDLLLQAGSLDDAERLLVESGPTIRSDPALTVSMIRLQLLRQKFDEADRWIETLREHGIPGHRQVQMGAACEISRRDDRAELFYNAALADGYFPEAKFGLARIALHRGDKVAARQLVLESLNVTQQLGDKARPALEFFSDAVSLLIQLEEPVSGASAWIAGVKVPGSPVDNHSFLIVAATEGDAERLLRQVVDSLRPTEPPLAPSQTAWKRAPHDQQPIGVVRPGLHRFWQNS